MVSHFSGSRDTADKLTRLQKYLQAYAIALKDQQFALLYIDAFAGSGTRVETRAALPLFDGGDAEPETIYTPGSARIALDVQPPLQLTFIEMDPARFSELQKLKEQHPQRQIVLHNGDANDAVQKICRHVPWHKKQHGIMGMRGVIFLDPYGMEVEWATVEAIAKTEALDCWYFFPLSGLYRNAPHNPAKLDAGKQASLDRVLGTTDWRQMWYPHSIQPKDMLESEEQAVVRADVDAIEQYVFDRLSSVFKGTVLKPLRLYHRSGAPLASLFFAVSNPRRSAVKVASGIASHILRVGNSSQVR
jgi:three-Cys-motif partner protein